MLSPMAYNAILTQLRKDDPRWKAEDEYPHTVHDLVLSRYMKKLLQFEHSKHVYSCLESHKANSAIQFWNESRDTKLTGNITLIYRALIQNQYRLFLFVNLHQASAGTEENLTPFKTRSRFQTKVVAAAQSDELRVVSVEQIITHIVVYPWPPGTYGIPRATKVICWSIDRGRRG